jgi:hypothetical protein
MTDTMIDFRTGKTYRINTCYYCDHDTYPKGKPIDPSDTRAQRTSKGDYKCGTCVDETTKKALILFNPNHPGSRKVIEDKQIEIDKWNYHARQINSMNRKRGKGGGDLMKYKRNPYLPGP